MDATWKDGDYFIRLRPMKGSTVTQEEIEQQLVINLMQLINARHTNPAKKKLGMRVQSYGSFNQARVDMLTDLKSQLTESYDKKKAEKWGVEGNRQMRQWATEMQEIADILDAVTKVENYLKKDLTEK